MSETERTETNKEEEKTIEEQLETALNELKAEKEAREREKKELAAEYARKLREVILSPRGGNADGTDGADETPAESVIKRVNARLK